MNRIWKFQGLIRHTSRVCGSIAPRDSFRASRSGTGVYRWLVAGACGLVFDAAAAPIVITGETSDHYRIVPKDGAVLVTRDTDAEARLHTSFFFHPDETQPLHELTKNMQTKKVSPAEVTLAYTKTEEHGTSGSLTHKLEIKTAQAKKGNQTIEVPALVDSVKASLVPGKREDPSTVSIRAGIVDPLVFSDTSSSAPFHYRSSGLEIGFSLGKETTFPSQFALTPSDIGAIAGETFFTFRFRVAPGAVSDPDLFWSSGLPGAVDLFTLKLQSDASFGVNATLATGTTTSNFVLDTTDTDTAEMTIENAFLGTGGRLPGDLENIFSVGFVPQANLAEYTIGFEREVMLTARENNLPAPASSMLLLTGGILLLANRVRRRPPTWRPTDDGNPSRDAGR